MNAGLTGSTPGPSIRCTGHAELMSSCDGQGSPIPSTRLSESARNNQETMMPLMSTRASSGSDVLDGYRDTPVELR